METALDIHNNDKDDILLGAVDYLKKVNRPGLAGAFAIFGSQFAAPGSAKQQQLLEAFQAIKETAQIDLSPITLSVPDISQSKNARTRLERLAAFTLPHMQEQGGKQEALLICGWPNKPLIDIKTLSITSSLQVSEFCNLDLESSCSSPSTVLVSGVVGQINLLACENVLQKAVSKIPIGGIIVVDVTPMDGVSPVELTKMLGRGDGSSANCLISRHDFEQGVATSFELVDFQGSHSHALPDIYVFRRVLERRKVSLQAELQYLIVDLKRLGDRENELTREGFHHYYLSLKAGGFNARADALHYFWAMLEKTRERENGNLAATSKFHYSNLAIHSNKNPAAQKRADLSEESKSFEADFLPVLPESKILKNPPRVILICPSPGFFEFILHYLKPSKILIYGLDKRPLMSMFRKKSQIVTYRGLWTKMSKQPDSSADFIISSNINKFLSRSQYLRLMREVARVRNKSGFVFFEAQEEGFLKPLNHEINLSKTGMEQTIQWVKSRDVGVATEIISIKGKPYRFIKEKKHYNIAIRQEIAAGRLDIALQQFSDALTSRQLSVREAVQALNLFADHPELAKATRAVCNVHFGVDAVNHHGLTHRYNSVSEVKSLATSFVKFADEDWAKPDIMFDLAGEFYRASGDQSSARKLWQKSYRMKRLNLVGTKNDIAALNRKCNLLQPCPIDRRHGESRFRFQFGRRRITDLKKPTSLGRGGGK